MRSPLRSPMLTVGSVRKGSSHGAPELPIWSTLVIHAHAYGPAAIPDIDLVFQPDLEVVVVLQTGQQLDGLLRRYEAVLEVEGVVFHRWQADDLLVDHGSHLAPL